MKTDLYKQIEEEAWNYGEQVHGNSYVKYQADCGYRAGYKSALHSSRWRKVSEELPDTGTQVLVRNKYGVCRVAHLLNNGWDHTFEFPPVEWKPID